MTTKVPFPVFEVKLAGSDMPASIQALIDTGVIAEAAKFSKFLTGSRCFQWYDGFVSAGTGLNIQLSHRCLIWARKNIRTMIIKVRERSGNRRGSSRSFATSETLLSDSSDSGASKASKDKKSLSGTSLFGETVSGRRKIAPKKAVRVEPKSYFANERTFIQ